MSDICWNWETCRISSSQADFGDHYRAKLVNNPNRTKICRHLLTISSWFGGDAGNFCPTKMLFNPSEYHRLHVRFGKTHRCDQPRKHRLRSRVNKNCYRQWFNHADHIWALTMYDPELGAMFRNDCVALWRWLIIAFISVTEVLYCHGVPVDI